MSRAVHLYLVHRGANYGEHWHPSLTPHRAIVCTARHTAKWEAGATDTRSWIWERPCTNDGHGWLLVRWNGLDIDYGHIVRGFKLPDGTGTGFSHPGNKAKDHRRPWRLLRGAVWWSEHTLPDWLRDRGVIEAPDDFTRERIRDDAGLCRLPYREQERWKARRATRKAGAQ